ncbi:tetratricopeptide repeat-containing sensor histidine kinase [Taibaiella soli]|nr:tetratricopeptide repeat protein [Taibaiella soli]
MALPTLKNSMFWTAILLLFFYCVPLRAQIQETPTAHAWYADTAYISALCTKAKAFEAINTDSALHFAAEAERISIKDLYYFGMGAALQRQASVHTIKGAYDDALELNNRAIEYFVWSAKKGEGKSLTHWSEGIVSTLSASANIYLTLGNPDKSMQLFFKALQLIEATDNDQYTLASIYNNIAGVHLAINQYDRARPYLEKTVAIASNSQPNPTLGIALSNLSLVWRDKGDTTKAMIYAQAAMNIARKSGDPRQMYGACMMLGDLYQIKENDSAIHYFQQTIKYGERLGAFERCASIFKTGSTYDHFKDYKNGAKYLNRALEIADSTSGRRLKLHIYDDLYRHYYFLKQYKEAVEYQYAYSALKDSIDAEKNAAVINQLDIRYKTSRKDQEIQHKQMLIAKQNASIDRKNRVITAVTAFIAILLCLFWLRHRTYKFRQREQTQKITELRQEKEIAVLKAVAGAEEEERKRIAQELHDGVSGTLSVIKMRFSALDADTQAGTKETIQLLDSVINDIRNTAHNLSPEMILSEGLQEAVTFFSNAVNQSQSIRIGVQFSGDMQQLPPDFQLSIFRIIQELIQNVIKHAQAKNVLLQLGFWENLFSLTVEDDGIGFDATLRESSYDNTATRPRNGLGLVNVRKRVKALHGELNVDSIPGSGTTVYIEFDLSN